jgi:hypothetical protein
MAAANRKFGVSMMKNLLALAAACGVLLGGATAATADEAAVPAPQGVALLLQVTADGVQIYTCEAKAKGFEWVFKAPEASLFDARGRQIGTHFAGPTWKLDDNSTVVGEVVAKADASPAGAIPWLLLRAKSHDGAGSLSTAAFIRRKDTKGGAAPTTGCDGVHVAAQARMRYSATYEFFSAPN